MGCVQSQDGKNILKRKKTRRVEEEAAAAHLLATQQLAAAQKAADAEKKEPKMEPGPQTEVMRRASQFDKLDEEAHKAPSLRDVKVVMGKQSQKLLEGFEAKEAEAKAIPELVDVKERDLRQSKLFDKLQEFEANDERVRQEPKLRNSFMKRENEKRSSHGTDSSGHSSGNSPMANVLKPISSEIVLL